MGNCINRIKENVHVATEMKITNKKEELKGVVDMGENAPYFEIKGFKTGKVMSVYDGDTFEIVFKFDGKFQRFKVRCYGYNSAEIRQAKSAKDREAKKLKALEDKNALSSKILNKVITINCLKFGKYGRLIAKVYVNDLYVNKWMVDNGYGTIYMTEPEYEDVDPIRSPSRSFIEGGELLESDFDI